MQSPSSSFFPTFSSFPLCVYWFYLLSHHCFLLFLRAFSFISHPTYLFLLIHSLKKKKSLFFFSFFTIILYQLLIPSSFPLSLPPFLLPSSFPSFISSPLSSPTREETVLRFFSLPLSLLGHFLNS